MGVQTGQCAEGELASMKALPNRKGNGHTGKVITSRSGGASMKVYTSRYRTSCPTVILRGR